jgi:hypothetical protein
MQMRMQGLRDPMVSSLWSEIEYIWFFFWLKAPTPIPSFRLNAPLPSNPLDVVWAGVM